MKVAIFFVFVSALLIHHSAFAQAGLIPGANDPSKADIKVLNSEGRLAHIVVTPQDKTLDYYVVGEKEGEINFNNLRLFSGQMNGSPAPTERPEHHPSAAVTKSQPQPTVVLRHVHFKPPIHRERKSNVVSVIAKRSPVKSLTPTTIQGKRRGGYPDTSWLVLLLLLLAIALYAHRTSLKVRTRQSARVF